MNPPAYGFSIAIIVHVAAALLTAGSAVWMLLARKGTPMHRVMGHVSAGLLATVAIGSFWIQTRGHLWWLHLLSVGTLVALAAGIAAARSGRIRAHQRTMIATYGSALLAAGVFTLLPSRLIGWHLWHALGLA